LGNGIKDITIDEIQKLLKSISIELEIKKQIGKGGQKVVYEIYDKKKDEVQIFKVLKSNHNSIDRLKREILAVKIINHENIPKVLGTNVDSVKSLDEIIWIIEEIVNGPSLRELIQKNRQFSLDEIVVFFDTMFSILKKSEPEKIVHRDIKPENILYDSDNKFWLIDFGISRHLSLDSITSSNSPFGPCTFGYSAAEQFRNRKKEIDIRADLFSIGVVAAEMIIGYNPYLQNTNDIIELIKKIENQPLPLLRIPGDSQFLLAKFIKNLGDNRLARRPRSVLEAINIFNIVKDSL
jgi:eukaryotic-like serine/threonine-protein kinase